MVERDRKRNIHDEQITFANYASFQSCEPVRGGKAVKFVMACGNSYTVGLPYLARWFLGPDCTAEVSRTSRTSGPTSRGPSAIRAIKCRRTLMRTAVRVYLNDGRVYVVPWDTVLMACEKEYEHYGGLTRESKKLTNRMARRYVVCVRG